MSANGSSPKGHQLTPKGYQLTLAQQVAIEATAAEIARLQQRMRAILNEAGLDPAKPYKVTPEGMVLAVPVST